MTMSDDNEIQNPDTQNVGEAPRRDIFFRVMLVLSMVNAASNFITLILFGAFLPVFQEVYDSGKMPLPEMYDVALESLLETPRYYFFIVSLFWALSFYGALAMWKYRTTGFHCYTLAQLILLLLPIVFLGSSHVAIGDIMLTLLFVVYYAIKVPFRRKFTGDNTLTD
jgi:hypothetical protein